MGGHEVTGASNGALLSQAGDLAGVVDLVVLEDAELLLLALMLVLLGGGVLLLLALLTTTAQTENQVEGGFLGLRLVIAARQHTLLTSI